MEVSWNFANIENPREFHFIEWNRLSKPIEAGPDGMVIIDDASIKI